MDNPLHIYEYYKFIHTYIHIHKYYIQDDQLNMAVFFLNLGKSCCSEYTCTTAYTGKVTLNKVPEKQIIYSTYINIQNEVAKLYKKPSKVASHE